MTKHDSTIQELALMMFDMTKRAWRKNQQAKFKGGYDLSESEFLALDALEEVDALSVGQLRREVAVLPSQMSRVIKALEQRYDDKLVLCAINPQDKRKIDVSITPTGRRAVDAYRQAKITQMCETLRRLSDKDLVAFRRIMERLRDSAEPDVRP